MCNCPSCELTDSYADKGFAEWPKGEHIRRHGKDKAYASHWNYCGAEAHRKHAVDFSTRLDGRNVPNSQYANREAFAVPLPDNDVWIPIFAWERETGDNYLDRYNEQKAEQQRKAA